MFLLQKGLRGLAFSALLFSAGLSAAESEMPNDLADIKAQLTNMLEDSSSAVITPTPVVGLYQIQVGMTVVYMSQDGQYLLNGSLVDLTTLANLTEGAKSATRKSLMDAVDVDSMIIYPAKGDPKHYMTVFTDIDCPYCAKLHRDIPELNKAGITVRYLSYPRTGVGSESYLKAVSVWCSKKSDKVMNEAMRGGAVKSLSCQHPVDKHLKLARDFSVNGTPNIVLDSGEILPGYVPANEIIKIFKQ